LVADIPINHYLCNLVPKRTKVRTISAITSLPLRKSPAKGFRGLHVAMVTIANTKQRISSFPVIVFCQADKKKKNKQ